MAGLSVPGFTLMTITIVLMLHLCRCEETIKLCDSTTCSLPDCFCAGNIIPGGLTSENTPQMVLFTFDDAVNKQAYGPLMDLFGMDKNRTNPNGCPISMTLFVSHKYTNYSAVAEFYRNCHEVASHSITHKLPVSYWADAPYVEYDQEIDGQRDLLSRLAGIPRDQIIGYRSPFIQPGGDVQFQVLKDKNFLYDSSLVFTDGAQDNRIWPYTLDFPYQVLCFISPCPTKGYPGLWELLIQPIPDQTGTLCNFLGTCEVSTTADEVYGYMMQSFNASYQHNRAPLIYNMHASWLENNNHALEGFHRFIDKLITMDDTYIITATQLIEWMRNPTGLAQLPNSELWKCNDFYTTSTTQFSITTNDKKSMLPPEQNRAKKSGFDAYILFGVCFVYLLYKEPV